MARLNKRHVEQLMSTYDTDPKAALLGALQIVLGDPTLNWPDAVNSLPTSFPRHDIERCDTTALDELLTHLVECRDLQQP